MNSTISSQRDSQVNYEKLLQDLAGDVPIREFKYELEDLDLIQKNLPQLIEKLEEVACNLRAQKDYRTAVETCLVSRVTWTTFFSTYGSSAETPPNHLRQRLKSALIACLDSLSDCIESLKHIGAPSATIEMVRAFQRNVAFRKKCFDRFESEGAKGVQQLLANELRKDPPFLSLSAESS